jgi:hypothetical protein
MILLTLWLLIPFPLLGLSLFGFTGLAVAASLQLLGVLILFRYSDRIWLNSVFYGQWRPIHLEKSGLNTNIANKNLKRCVFVRLEIPGSDVLVVKAIRGLPIVMITQGMLNTIDQENLDKLFNEVQNRINSRTLAWGSGLGLIGHYLFFRFRNVTKVHERNELDFINFFFILIIAPYLRLYQRLTHKNGWVISSDSLANRLGCAATKPNLLGTEHLYLRG